MDNGRASNSVRGSWRTRPSHGGRSLGQFSATDTLGRGRASNSVQGSWRSRPSHGGLSLGRGSTWHRSRAQVPSETIDTTPFGRLVTNITLDDASSFITKTDSPKISDCKYIASYSLMKASTQKIIIPGQPATWTPLELPSRLPGDQGEYLRDQNGARFPDYPMQPSVQSIFALNKEFDPSSVDILGCASSLGDILRFVRSVDLTFRFDVEIIGDTLFLVRNHRNQVIPDVRGYGHSFLNAFLTHGAELQETVSHQRIVSYSFGGLKCLVRYECDGHFSGSEEKSKATAGEKKVSGFPKFPASNSITMEPAGNVIPQESILEVKTKSQARDPIDMAEHLPRLWLRQIPSLITAYHRAGNFEDVQEKVVREDLLKWESDHELELRKFASILRQLIIEVKRASHLKLELCRTGLGPLELREQSEKPREALPNEWREMWTEQRREPTRDSKSYLSDDEDGEGSYPDYLSSKDWSDESYDFDDDVALDYTACDVECGYCGRCDY